MVHVDRRFFWGRPWRGVRYALLIGLASCASSIAERPRADGELPGASLPVGSALHLRGELRGPLPGWGPRVQIEAWLREDGWLRADLRTPAERGTTHEVLLWTPEVALLLDRQAGRFTELGDSAGRIEALGTDFRVEEAIWMLSGRALGELARPGSWEWVRAQWRYRGPDRGLRSLQRGGELRWTEMVWREDDGRVHRLRADVEELQATPWGAVPRALSLEGTDLDGRALLRWQIEPIVALGDSIYDPLWEPSGR